MAISMGAALLGSAVIGGVGSAISGSKNSKAIRQSTAAQNAADERALAAQVDARNQNVAFQSPIYQTGIAAMNRRNALLGLDVQQPQMPQQQPQFTRNGMNSMTFASGDPMLGDMGLYSQQTQNQPTTNALADAQQGFSNWRDNTGYQFRFNEGIRAVDAGAPVRNSGSTIKARMQYGQNIGSQEFYNHLGALGEQQQLAPGAANALSGVQTNYANNASAIAQNQGQTAANAAVARANNTNAMINGITSSFGNALGAYGSNQGWFRT